MRTGDSSCLAALGCRNDNDRFTVLFGEGDFFCKGGVAGVGVEGFEGEVGAEGGDPEVVFLAGDVEPFECVVTVPKFGVELGDPERGDRVSLGVALR